MTNEKSKINKYSTFESAMMAVRINPMELEFVLESTPNYREIVLEAVKSYGMALQFAPTLQDDREVVFEAVKSDGWALSFAPKFHDDREIILEGMKNYSLVANLASENLRNSIPDFNIIKILKSSPKKFKELSTSVFLPENQDILAFSLEVIKNYLKRLTEDYNDMNKVASKSDEIINLIITKIEKEQENIRTLQNEKSANIKPMPSVRIKKLPKIHIMLTRKHKKSPSEIKDSIDNQFNAIASSVRKPAQRGEEE